MMTTKISAIATTRGIPKATRRAMPGWIRKAMAAPRTRAPRKVAEEVKNHDGDDEGNQAKDDLKVAPAALGIHGQGGHDDGSGFFRLDGVDNLFGMGARAHCNQGSMTRMCGRQPRLRVGWRQAKPAIQGAGLNHLTRGWAAAARIVAFSYGRPCNGLEMTRPAAIAKRPSRISPTASTRMR